MLWKFCCWPSLVGQQHPQSWLIYAFKQHFELFIDIQIPAAARLCRASSSSWDVEARFLNIARYLIICFCWPFLVGQQHHQSSYIYLFQTGFGEILGRQDTCCWAAILGQWQHITITWHDACALLRFDCLLLLRGYTGPAASYHTFKNLGSACFFGITDWCCWVAMHGQQHRMIKDSSNKIGTK